MKRFVLLILALFLLFSCVSGPKTPASGGKTTPPAATDPAKATTEPAATPAPTAAPDAANPNKENLSYAIGVSLGTSIGDVNILLEYDSFLQAIKDVIENKSPKVTISVAQETISNFINNEGSNAPDPDKPRDKDLSYAVGVSVGDTIINLKLPFEYDPFMEGIKDSMDKKAPLLSYDEANAKISAALSAIRLKASEANIQKEKEFLEKNKTEKDVVTTESGLQYIIVKKGNGIRPNLRDTVKVHYVGKLADGKVFDSSVERNEPAIFPIEGLIQGWIEGIPLMDVGSKYTFFIPSELGYGAEGAGDVIGPYEVLIFDVELLAIEKN